MISFNLFYIRQYYNFEVFYHSTAFGQTFCHSTNTEIKRYTVLIYLKDKKNVQNLEGEARNLEEEKMNTKNKTIQFMYQNSHFPIVNMFLENRIDEQTKKFSLAQRKNS